MIFTLLFLLPIVQQVTQGNGEISTILERNKRDLISYICPRKEATGDDLGQNGIIIFHSPIERKDVTIRYGNGTWGDEAMKQLVENGFNSTKPTLLFSHGFHQSANQTWLMNARALYDKAYSNSSDAPYNMFIFDWSYYSNYEYWNAVSYVPHLGKVLGQFLEEMGKSQSYDVDKFHLIAYSLSTHIAGLAGRHVASSYAPIGQLTALDPTGVCLHNPSSFASANALRPTDAKFVVARHYNMDGLGAKRPIGGLDILVNGGKEQPNPPGTRQYLRSLSRFARDVRHADDGDVLNDTDMVVMARSDHHRATEHECQALDEQCHDMAYECGSYEAYLRGECADCGPDGTKCYFVSNFKQLLNQEKGEQLRSKIGYAPGTKMFLKTHYQEPFCLHQYQMLAELSPNASAISKKLLSSGAVEIKLEDDQIAKLSGQSDENKFTALISSVNRIQNLNGMTLKVNANNSTFGAFLDSLDHVELNYMSHPTLEERAKASYRLCLSESRNSLVKCQDQ